MKTKILSLLGALAACMALMADTQVPANPGLIVTYKSVAKAYTLTYSDYFVACHGTNFTVTLPSVSDGRVGCTFKIAATGTNTVTVAPASGDTIAGSTNSVSVTTHTSLVLTSDGTSDWNK